MNAKQRLILEIENSPDFIVREVRKSLLIAKAKYAREQARILLKSSDTEEKPDPYGKPIWELFDEAVKNLPEEVISELPTDGAAQADHYIYGTPKQEE